MIESLPASIPFYRVRARRSSGRPVGNRVKPCSAPTRSVPGHLPSLGRAGEMAGTFPTHKVSTHPGRSTLNPPEPVRVASQTLKGGEL